MTVNINCLTKFYGVILKYVMLTQTPVITMKCKLGKPSFNLYVCVCVCVCVFVCACACVRVISQGLREVVSCEVKGNMCMCQQ